MKNYAVTFAALAALACSNPSQQVLNKEDGGAPSDVSSDQDSEPSTGSATENDGEAGPQPSSSPAQPTPQVPSGETPVSTAPALPTGGSSASGGAGAMPHGSAGNFGSAGDFAMAGGEAGTGGANVGTSNGGDGGSGAAAGGAMANVGGASPNVGGANNSGGSPNVAGDSSTAGAAQGGTLNSAGSGQGGTPNTAGGGQGGSAPVEDIVPAECVLVDGNIVFDEARVETAVREAVGVFDRPLNPTDVADLLTLEFEPLGFNDSGIQSIGGVECLTSLRRLAIPGHFNLENFAPLGALLALEDLDLYRALTYRNDTEQIQILRLIASLPELSTLRIGFSNVRNISPLAAATNLEVLDLNNNPLLNLLPLSGLTALRYLQLGNTQTNNVAALAGLVSLEELHLLNNQISDLGPLQGLSGLVYLSLYDNSINDLSPLSDLDQLEFLDVGLNDDISDLSALSNLVQLNELVVTANAVVDLSPLAALAALQRLDMRGNQISDVSALGNLSELTQLLLGSNPVADIDALAALTELTDLDLSFTEVTDAALVGSLPALTSLTLRNSAITDTAPLLSLTTLVTLNLRGIPIECPAQTPNLVALEVTVAGNAGSILHDCQISGQGPSYNCTTGCSGCVDADADGYGNAGPACAGTDCDDSDVAWYSDCWIRDLFPAERPATITVTGTTVMDDTRCVMVANPTGCLPQNDPACMPATEEQSVTLDLTINEQNQLSVEAPYQDMCAPDYFCAVTGPSCPVPTSYPIPLLDERYYYDPRATDRCREDQIGTDIQVEHVVTVTGDGSSAITIRQECFTQMRNDTNFPPTFVFDQRDWTTTIEF